LTSAAGAHSLLLTNQPSWNGWWRLGASFAFASGASPLPQVVMPPSGRTTAPQQCFCVPQALAAAALPTTLLLTML
jgi:hypothetical protein